MFARPRPAPFAVSALTHGIILGWLTTGPVFEKPASVYQQAIAPHASKLVWYNFREKLPNVSPAPPKADAKPPRAEIKLASQEIVAGSPQAPRTRQFIWQPLPKVELKHDLQSPNVVALHTPAAPVLPPPPPPAPKPFTPPPETKKAAVPKPVLDAPPELRLARNVNAAGAIGNVLGARPAKLQPRAFVAPPVGQSGTGVLPALPTPPPVQVNLDASGAAALGSAPAAPARRVFVASSDHAKPSAFGPVLAEGPALDASASNSGVSLAIVSLNPGTGAAVPLPEGSRNGQFSAGPVQRANGGADGTGDGATLVVPGLMIRNGTRDAHPALVASAAPTSASNLRAAMRSRGVPDPPAATATAAATAGLNPSAARVPAAPDPILFGRAIYAMTVQMPNISSYSGSWLIWFAERQYVPGAAPHVRAPIPVRKVDPKYVPSAIADGIEGKVRLAAVIRMDGHVDSVRLLQHLDDRLDQSAQEAMHKWQFQPALRNGQPVDVDAVVEIPFHLAPKVVTP